MNGKQLTAPQCRSSDVNSTQDAGYLEELHSVVSTMWNDFFPVIESCIKKDGMPHEKVKKSNVTEDPSITASDNQENSNLGDASCGVSIVYKNLGPSPTYTLSSSAAGRSDPPSDLEGSSATSESEQMSSILIDHNVLGSHEKHENEKSVLNSTGRFKWSTLDSATMSQLPKEKQLLPPRLSTTVPRRSAASSVASPISTEALNLFHRPNDNIFQKPSGERVTCQTKEPNTFQHSADKLQKFAERRGPESSLPEETFLHLDSCVYSDASQGPLAGTLEGIRNVMLFLESFPRTSKYSSKDPTGKAGETHEMKRAVAVSSEPAKDMKVTNTQKADFHEHATDHSHSSRSQPQRVVPVEHHAEAPRPGKAEATAPAPAPVAHPPRVPIAASHHYTSESAPKSVGKQSLGQRLLQCLKSAVAPGHRKPTVAVMTIFLLVVVVTVTWNFDYIFPSPSSDIKDTAGPFKGSTNETEADEVKGVPLGPLGILFTDNSVNNEEI